MNADPIPSDPASTSQVRQSQQSKPVSQIQSTPPPGKTQAPIQLNIEKSNSAGRPAVDICFKVTNSANETSYIKETFYFNKINGVNIEKLFERFKKDEPGLSGQDLKNKFVGKMIEKYSDKIARASHKFRQTIKSKHGGNQQAIMQEIQGKVFSVAKSQGWFDKGLTLAAYKTIGKNKEGKMEYDVSSHKKVKSWRSRQAYNITHARAFGWIRRGRSQKSTKEIWVVNEMGKVERKKLSEEKSFSKTELINETGLRLIKQWRLNEQLPKDPKIIDVKIEKAQDGKSTTTTGTKIELKKEEEEVKIPLTKGRETEEGKTDPAILKNEIMAKINTAETFKSKELLTSKHLQRIDSCEQELAKKFKELEETHTKQEIQILFSKELKNKKRRQQLQHYAPSKMNKIKTFFPPEHIKNKDPNLDLHGRLRDNLDYENYEMEEKT